MNETDRISGDQGSIKPEKTLTDIVRTVAYSRGGDQAPMRAAANGALIRWLKDLEDSDAEADREVVQFALEREGFDSVNGFVESFFESGEPVMAARTDLADIDTEDLNLDDGQFTAELQEPEDGGG